MKSLRLSLLVLAMVAGFGVLNAQALVVPYSQDFETLGQTDPNALSGEGWVVYGNVFSPTGTYLYGYGTFPAPNDGAGFCQIDTLQGGVDQGTKQLVVFSDYNNTDHATGNIIESNVFLEMPIDSTNIGQIWTMAFDAKLGNIEGQSTAAAFIKTIDPAHSYNMTNFINVDMTTTPVSWQGYTLSISLADSALAGQLLQIGFMNTATLYQGSGIFYDNINFYLSGASAVPATLAGAQLLQNYPNPFNPRTRIDFRLDEPGPVSLAVYDLAGRRVAVLADGRYPAGMNSVQWDGRTLQGAPAAAGRYNYVLRTRSGVMSRPMTLVK